MVVLNKLQKDESTTENVSQKLSIYDIWRDYEQVTEPIYWINKNYISMLVLLKKKIYLDIQYFVFFAFSW